MRVLIFLLNLLNFISNIRCWYKNFGVSINNPECIQETQPIMEYYKIEDYQYMFFSERVPWDEACVICPGYDSRLAVVDTPTKASKLAAAIAESNIEIEDIWIGGTRSDAGEWAWINKQRIPSERINGFPPWVQIPNRPLKDCLAMDRIMVDLPLFVDLDCQLPKPFVCQRVVDGPINSDIILPSHMVTAETSTYIFYHARMCWATAVAFCSIHGYRLAIIPDNKIAKIISTAMLRSRPSFEDMWISGHFNRGKWKWLSTGEVIESYPKENNYPPWHHNSTNHTGGCILFDRYLCEDPVFLASKCDMKRDFICEKFVKNKTHRAKVGPTTIVYQNWTMILVLKDLSWYDAQEYCKGQNAYLTEVYDYGMMRAITTAMSDQESEPLHVWLGGMQINDTWVWMHTNQPIPETTDDETGFVPWCNIEKEDNDDDECLNMDREAHVKPTVYSLSCKVEQPFICTITTDGDSTPSEETTIAITQPTIRECNQKPVISAINRKAYVAFFTPVTFSNAKAACVKAGTNVAKVKEHELESLVNNLRKNTVDCAEQHLWIETRENCSYIRFDTEKSYKNEICSDVKGYICEINCSQTIPIAPPFNKDMWNCADKNLKMCKVLPSCPDTTTTRATTEAPIPTCKHSAISISSQTKAYEVFFTPYAYERVATECSRAGGSVATIKQETIAAIVNSILTIKDPGCSDTNFWVLGDEKCSELKIHNKAVQSTQDCMKRQGFICEAICSVPKSLDEFNQTIWNCDKKNYLECTIECVDAWVLVGPDTMICTNAGWVTNYNQTTYLPSCRKQNSFADEFSENMQDALEETYTGLLFIVDESYSITSAEWLLQLQFVATMIQAFPLSSTFPMGLILFSSNATVTIPYNATDTCKVLEILNRLTPAKDRDFTNYKDALEVGAKQIKQLHDDQQTLIFFVSDGDNNGDIYTDILTKLKEKHLIISIGISDTQMDDLNEVASTRNNRLLMFKFKIFEDLQTFTRNFLEYRSQNLTCRKELYTLSSHATAILRQAKPTVISPTTAESACSHPASLLPHKASTFVIFFNRHSYKTANNMCSTIGGKIAELKPEYVREVVDSISKVDDATCIGLNFWVKGDAACKELNIQNQVVHVSNNCMKQQGYICEIVCSTTQPSATFNQTRWNCKHEENKLSCKPQCEAESVLIGSDYVTCTNAGWVTTRNEPILLPSCQDQPMAADSVLHLPPLSEPHNGFIFVVDESYSISVPEWWIQMQFVASVIQMFSLSSNLPMGLILFAKEVRVPIPYNATDTCKVLETIRKLRPSAERDFTYYDRALKEADKQIKERGSSKSTVIFFISDGDHNGDSYEEISEELRKRHTIISVGISSDPLNDLNEVASSKGKSLLMYKFKNFNSFQKFAISLKKFRSKALKCDHERLFLLPGSVTCTHPAMPVAYGGKTFVIFFTPYNYEAAYDQCINAGGQMVEVKPEYINQIVNSILTINKPSCTEKEFWTAASARCTELNAQQKTIQPSGDCLKEQGFICEIACIKPQGADTHSQTAWTCEKNDYLECAVECKDRTILIGSDKMICTNTGWVTNKNKTTYIPSCQNEAEAADSIIQIINKFKNEYSGFLFIVDESYNIKDTEWWLQLQFVASMIQVFPLSSKSRMGMMMFTNTVKVTILYNETSTCKVLEKLHGLHPSGEKDFASFKKVLVEAEKQIKRYDNNQPTIIFFITDGMNNGEEYYNILEKLKKRHVIISLGINVESVDGLSELASMQNDVLLMYKFPTFDEFNRFTINLTERRSKTVMCQEKLYTLPEGTNDAPIQQRIFTSADETVCNNQSTPIEANGVTYTVFYHELTYSVAKYYCKNLGKRLAHEKVTELKEITNLITKRLETCKDPVVQLWINRKDVPCAILDITPVRLRSDEFEDPCSKQLSFICESGCPDHPTDKMYANNIWRCSNKDNEKKCHANCKNKAIMVGTNTLLCSATNGWVTLNNYTTNFPVCLMSKDFESELISQISKLKKDHHGFLFVFDISSFTSTETTTLSQLEFMEALLEVFPPSKYFPVGLILFDEQVAVPMSYLETSFCTVLRKLEHLKNNAVVDTDISENRLSFYNVALQEVQKQIEIIQPRRKTVIFFVSDHLNNGDEYIDIAINLKKKHTIFSIGNGYGALNDLNIIASMNADNPLMYNFQNYKHLEDIMKLIKHHHGKQHKCTYV